ncbi:Hypothetical predicted protein [Xyrichtys novacula]|uniref:Uncharacterized protein n=1 Tax=Xyrichtys novacula TaxID=13765 RepID=A0AAV1G3Y2_XYRNO|nr:Hypothetical predicted protein [Xyrichtys novacula]
MSKTQERIIQASPPLDGGHRLLMRRRRDSDFQSGSWLRIRALHRSRVDSGEQEDSGAPVLKFLSVMSPNNPLIPQPAVLNTVLTGPKSTTWRMIHQNKDDHSDGAE